MISNQVNKQKGFSLLEILIAFSILAISLGILLKIFSAGINTAVVAEDYTVAALSDAAITQIVATNVTRWQTLGYGTWLFFDENDIFVGYAGLKPTAIGGADSIELLYGVVPDFWRQGVATTMVATVLNHADTALNLPRLVGYTLTSNTASQQVLLRHDFVYQGDISHVALPHYWYVRMRDC